MQNILKKSVHVTLICAGLFLPLTSYAITVKFCTKWRVQFLDSGNGEDLITTTSVTSVNAKWTHYQVRLLSNNSLVASGILDNSGCTPNLTLAGNTEYRFRQATKVEVTGNRRMYIQNPSAPDYGMYYTWLNTNYTTPLYDTTAYLNPDWQTSQANVTAIAGQALAYYSSREYPADTYTYIWPKDSHNTSFLTDGTHNIAIDTNWLHMSGTPQYGMNHAYYKFIVAHELGHHQAQETGGPLHAQYGINIGTSKCNCNHFPVDYRDMCFQSQEYIGTAESEAWAYFYASAIFNDRQASCGMGYFRAMYTGATPQTATLDEIPPFPVNCAATPKWMENLCSNTDRGVLQDWLGFYWNTWTTGTSYTIDEMTDIWDVTGKTGVTGERWNDLVASVEDIGSAQGWSIDKIDQFSDKGDLAGVNY